MSTCIISWCLLAFWVSHLINELPWHLCRLYSSELIIGRHLPNDDCKNAMKKVVVVGCFRVGFFFTSKVI